MSAKATYFLSDLHLGASYFSNPRMAEKRVTGFLRSIARDAEAIYLVGDVLDFWFEYRTVVPRGFVRFFGTLAELSDSGVKITWLIGNHDIWIFDYLPAELGIEVVDGTLERDIYGRRFFITHGDGVGRLPTTFRFIRGMFRNPLCQKMFASLHPRLTIPLAFGWSSKNRGQHPVAEKYKGPDAEPLMQFARSCLATRPSINYFVFGHRHIAVEEKIAPHCSAVILGEWIDSCDYAVIRPGEPLRLMRYRAPLIPDTRKEPGE